MRRIASLSPLVPPRDVIDRYRGFLGDRTSNARIWNAVRTDALMTVPNGRVALAHAANGGPTFVYRFAWDAPRIGAAHGVDLPFTFGTLDRDGWDAVVGSDGRAERLGRTWRGCWAAFASTGNPSPPECPWPTYGPERRVAMVFDADGATTASTSTPTTSVWSVD
jgi:para-nitrobenzyl esterase